MPNDFKEIKNEFDTQYEQEITCPYCGYVFGDSWEYNDSLEHGDDEMECPECYKTFSCSMDVDVKYSTYKVLMQPCEQCHGTGKIYPKTAETVDRKTLPDCLTCAGFGKVKDKGEKPDEKV